MRPIRPGGEDGNQEKNGQQTPKAYRSCKVKVKRKEMREKKAQKENAPVDADLDLMIDLIRYERD